MLHLLTIMPFHYIYKGFNPEQQKYKKIAKGSFLLYNGMFAFGIILTIMCYFENIILNLILIFFLFSVILYRCLFGVEFGILRRNSKIHPWVRHLLLNILISLNLLVIGLVAQTTLWMIGSALWLSYTFCRLIRDLYFKTSVKLSYVHAQYVLGSSVLIFPITIGTLNAASIHWFYSTTIQSFATILGIFVMIGTYLLIHSRSNESDKDVNLQKKSLLKAIIGLSLIYITVIIISIIGIITINEFNNAIPIINLDLNSILPSTLVQFRVLPQIREIFITSIFIFILASIIGGLGYLFRLTSDIFKIKYL